jgi:hypothetical protein
MNVLTVRNLRKMALMDGSRRSALRNAHNTALVQLALNCPDIRLKLHHSLNNGVSASVMANTFKG